MKPEEHSALVSLRQTCEDRTDMVRRLAKHVERVSAPDIDVDLEEDEAANSDARHWHPPLRTALP